jgi:hypothetical protein
MAFKRWDERTRLCGIAGRMVQLKRFGIAYYVGADNERHVRDNCYIHGNPFTTKEGNLCVSVFVENPEEPGTFSIKTIRLDRIHKRYGRWFYAAGNKFRSYRERVTYGEHVSPP